MPGLTGAPESVSLGGQQVALMAPANVPEVCGGAVKTAWDGLCIISRYGSAAGRWIVLRSGPLPSPAALCGRGALPVRIVLT